MSVRHWAHPSISRGWDGRYIKELYLLHLYGESDQALYCDEPELYACGYPSHLYVNNYEVKFTYDASESVQLVVFHVETCITLGRLHHEETSNKNLSMFCQNTMSAINSTCLIINKILCQINKLGMLTSGVISDFQ